MPDLMVEVASSDLEVLAAMEGLAMDLASGDLDDMMGSEGRGEAGSEDCTESGSERESNVGESTEGSTVDDFDHGHGVCSHTPPFTLRPPTGYLTVSRPTWCVHVLPTEFFLEP